MTKEEALKQLQDAEAALAAAKVALAKAKSDYKAAGALRLWVPDEDEPVYFVIADGVVGTTMGASALSPNDVSLGNAIRSKEEAGKQVLRARVFAVLNRLATEAGNSCGVRQVGVDQWTPFVTAEGTVRASPVGIAGALPTAAYFPTAKLCREAIDVLGDEIIRTAAQ